jgi:hypothetical protein
MHSPVNRVAKAALFFSIAKPAAMLRDEMCRRKSSKTLVPDHDYPYAACIERDAAFGRNSSAGRARHS